MKKLLVLALVLSMTTMAYAGLQFETSTGLTAMEVAPSQTITVQVVTEAGTSVDGWGFDAVIGQGTVSGAAILQQTVFENRTLGATNPATGILAQYTYASNTDTPAVYTTGVLYDFVLHIPDLPASTIITINTMDDGGNLYLPAYYFAAGVGEVDGNWDALVLHVTPEPMTMCLLGLGGLFLRRRK